MSTHKERKASFGTYELYLYENLTNPAIIFTDESLKQPGEGGVVRN